MPWKRTEIYRGGKGFRRRWGVEFANKELGLVGAIYGFWTRRAAAEFLLGLESNQPVKLTPDGTPGKREDECSKATKTGR